MITEKDASNSTASDIGMISGSDREGEQGVCHIGVSGKAPPPLPRLTRAFLCPALPSLTLQPGSARLH